MNPVGSAGDPNLPAPYWNQLSQEDKSEFIKLRASFHHGQKISSKDRRVVTFRRELLIVLSFLERSSDNMETRAVLAGVCFAGPIICVNTRQLKAFLARCKSSINGSFQQLDFVALRTKAKARDCILAVLPSLQAHQSILRQWTVRYTSENAQFCFLSSMSHDHCPSILPEDLFEEKRHVPAPLTFSRPTVPVSPPLLAQMLQPPPAFTSFGPRPAPVLHPKILDSELVSLDAFAQPQDQPKETPMKVSFSMNDFAPFGINWDADEDVTVKKNMKKSGSVQVPSFGRVWNLFDEEEDDSLF
jgi:hypothetical protein